MKNPKLILNGLDGTNLEIDEKPLQKQLSEKQDIICLDRNAYLGYLAVAIRMNPEKVNAKIVKGF